MTHTYNISGMTCNNCVAKVKGEVLKMGEVLSADVQLQSPQATITMQKHIPVSSLQQAISKAGNYTIAEEGGYSTSVTVPEEETDVSRLQTYKPLLLVFAFISGISLITSFQQGSFNWMMAMQHFMAGFFIAFSFFKFLDLKGFAESYSTYDLLAQKWTGYGYLYPFIELGLGIAYLTDLNPVATGVLTILVMGFSAIGVIKAVLAKRRIQCACLGAVFNLPMSTVTIAEDVSMIVMAVLMLSSLAP